jgi:hypothetical protein
VVDLEDLVATIITLDLDMAAVATNPPATVTTRPVVANNKVVATEVKSPQDLVVTTLQVDMAEDNRLVVVDTEEVDRVVDSEVDRVVD